MIEIKVAGPESRADDATLLSLMKCHDATAAQARLVTLLCWNERQQFVRDGNRRTPARTFVGCSRAELTLIQLAA